MRRRDEGLERGRGAIVFDGPFDHEVWNDADSTRIVLLLRFWHPLLASEDAQRAALRQIESQLAAQQRLKLLPPLGPGLREPGPALEARLRGSDEACPGCGSSGEAVADVSLDEDRGGVMLIARSCGHIVE